MNTEYIQALIARIEAGKNKIEDFPQVIRERIADRLQELNNEQDENI